jgi:hypothetical protein
MRKASKRAAVSASHCAESYYYYRAKSPTRKINVSALFGSAAWRRWAPLPATTRLCSTLLLDAVRRHHVARDGAEHSLYKIVGSFSQLGYSIPSSFFPLL